MKLTTLALCALAALCSTGVAAQKKKIGKKEAPLVRIRPMVRPVPADSFSYAVGLAQGDGLKRYLVQQLGVDTAYMDDVVRGLTEAYDETHTKRQQAYAAGLTIARQNRKDIVPALNRQATGKADTTYVDVDLLSQGLSDALLHRGTLTAADAQAKVERQMRFHQEQLNLANTAWLAANARRKDVVTTKSGLQYRVLTKGTGAVAADSNEVEVNYEGKLLDGKVFDSSYTRGKTATFKPSQVIKGWTEALTMMPEGSVWELYIPSELGYGERGSGSIPPNSILVFKVEVVKVKQ